ncbi:c-type cytochrome biogenesis protein CcmI [Pelagibius sp. Alg239-R121]|uniref:c-type cytochrome biogenesis protein CcmI n=1 Tax=Pelagibius sp. Alg239-R121 TaxID=2993448 RepID=UPI0024A74FB8|nr:c-type cytochrome biogenesis protein CcmI [Pelagibius sp. Alg239-R121]
MMIWIIAAVLTAICVAVLMNTLLRSRADHGPRSAFDLTVYKDQLTEIDRDLDRGLLNEVQASSARLEIERRMLAVAETNEASAGDAHPDGRGGASRWMAWFLAAALPGLALGLYLNLGSPNLPAVPYADRRALENEFQKAMTGDLQSEITQLEQRVQAQGLDAHAWLLLAGAYGDLNRFLDSANAYRRAIDLGAKEPQLYASLGEALVAASGGEVNTEARRAFAEAITLDSGNMKSLYYSGLALAQDGRLPAALRIWTNVLERSSPGTPWHPLLQQRIAQLETAIAARQTSSGESEASDAAEGSAMPQPSADDVEAASRMSGEEQMAFIRSMVDRLAERLDSQPADLEGWLRLARAYSVLQEPAKARQALARASEAFAGQPQEPQAEAAIARARSELGL